MKLLRRAVTPPEPEWLDTCHRCVWCGQMIQAQHRSSWDSCVPDWYILRCACATVEGEPFGSR